MSAPSQPAPHHADIEDRILAQLDGFLTPEEERALFAEIAQDPRLQQLYEDFRRQERLLETWHAQQAARIPADPPALGVAAPASAVVPVRRRLHLPLMAAAAAIALAAGLGTIAVLRGAEAGAEVLAAGGRPQLVTPTGLDDLAPATRLESRTGKRLKTGARGYLEVALPGGAGAFEMNANTTVRLLPNGIALEGGEALVRAGGRTVRLEAADLVVSTSDAHLALTRGLRGAEVAVISGTAEVTVAGRTSRLRAGETFSTVGSPPLPAATRTAWSRHQSGVQARAPEPPTPPWGDWPPLTPLGDVTDLSLEAARAATVTDTSLFLPTNTYGFLELNDLTPILRQHGASSFAELLDPAAIRLQLERQGAFADLTPEERDQVEFVLNRILGDPHVRTVLESIRGGLTIGFARGSLIAIIDVSGHEDRVRNVVQGHLGPLTALAEVREQIRIDVAGHCLVIGRVGPELDETIAALRAGRGTPFADGFLAETHADTRGSSVVFALDAARLAADVPETARKAFGRLGLANMHSLVAADRFGDQARNQALRVRFNGPRQGVAGWLDRPGAMGSLRFFSPNTHALACAKIERPAVMLDQLFAWMREDMPRVPTPKTEEELAVARRLAASLGNEVAVGLDNPILPVPHIKAVVEVVDPIAFHDSMTALLEALWASDTPASNATVTTSTHRGRLVVEVVVPGLPVPLAYAVVEDFAVFGPGRAFVQATIDTALDGRSLDRESTFQQALPAASGSFASALYYQAVNNSLRQALPALSTTFGPGSAELRRAFAGIQGGQAMVTYAVAHGERIDVFVEGIRVDDSKAASLLPAVAELVAR